MFKHNWLTRFLSLAMIVGALFALYFFGMNIPQKIEEGDHVAAAIFLAMAALFLVSLFFGFQFLRGNVLAFRWVTWLFVSQIPIIAWGPVEMRWFTGFEIPVILNGIQEGLLYLTYHANIGFEASFVFGGAVEETALGINLSALIASILLFRARGQAQATRGGELEVAAPQS